jgi:Rrf2 family protein
MILSKPTSYAIRALVHLASARDNTPVLGATIAEKEQLPAPFLSKLLRTLANSGIVKATRGPGGGFVLAKKPDDINLFEIFVMFEGMVLANECLLGCGVCADETPCPIHELWGPKKIVLESFLGGTTIGDLVRLQEKNGPRKAVKPHSHAKHK